jgi:hypothetical protein
MIRSLPGFFRRSLGVESRRHRTYLVRELLLVATMIAVIAAHVGRAVINAPGRWLFSVLASISAVVILLAGPLYFAAAITEEKENFTLGLLKMTGVRPAGLLLGTATSEMLVAAGFLLAQLPFVVLAVTLGGVSLYQIAEGYVALLAHLVLVSNIALFFSVVCRRGSQAAALTVLALVVFYLGPPTGDGLVRAAVADGLLSPSGAVAVWLGRLFRWGTASSVWSRLSDVLATGFAGPAIGFQAVSNICLGAVAFLASSAVFERATREEVSVGPRRGRLLGRSPAIARLGIGRVWGNALVWKDFYFLGGGKGGLVLRAAGIGLIVAVVAAVMALVGEDVGMRKLGSLAATVALVVGVVQLVLLHAGVLNREWRWGTVDSLAVLPLSTYAVVRHKLLGCLLALAPAGLWLLAGAALAWTRDSETGFWFGLVLPFLWVSVLAQLALLTSLLVKRGGLLIAVVAWWLASSVAMPIFVLMLWPFPWAGPVAGLLALCGTVALLHIAAVRRFGRLAAES